MAHTAGREYTVVGWCRHKWILDDTEKLEGLLKEICHRVDMVPLTSMSVQVEAELAKLNAEKFEDEGGASASLILSTSHINIHGWPYRNPERSDGGFFWFTIGSCRDFVADDIDAILDEKLGVTDVNRFEREILVP